MLYIQGAKMTIGEAPTGKGYEFLEDDPSRDDAWWTPDPYLSIRCAVKHLGVRSGFLEVDSENMSGPEKFVPDAGSRPNSLLRKVLYMSMTLHFS